MGTSKYPGSGRDPDEGTLDLSKLIDGIVWQAAFAPHEVADEPGAEFASLGDQLAGVNFPTELLLKSRSYPRDHHERGVHFPVDQPGD